MNRLSDHSSIRNPFLTPKQCNWMAPVISREGKVVGTLYCPKDVWTELRESVEVALLPLPFETSAGFYCPAHFFRMLALETAAKH